MTGTDQVIDTRTVHTSGASDSTSLPGADPAGAPAGAPALSGGGTTLEQCMTEFGTASSGCAGATIAPGTFCCDGVLALGSSCLSMLAEAAGQLGADPAMAAQV